MDRCDKDIYENGEHVATITGANAKTIEEFVKNIAKISSQPVDWHYAAGRAMIRTTGNIKVVKEYLKFHQMQIDIEE